MDALITGAARALAAGDALGALGRVGLRDDAPALALRGIAMAQLGEFSRATALLKRARRAFGCKETLARARCTVAEAEVALASRNLGWPADRLDQARGILEHHGDHANAAQVYYLEARRQLLVGQVNDAEKTLGKVDPSTLSPAAIAIHQLLLAGIALRRIQTRTARKALHLATQAANAARIPALIAEVDTAYRVLEEPAAYKASKSTSHIMRLADVEDLLASDTLVVDACRYVIRHRYAAVSLINRPVLFALARALADAWPGDMSRDTLIKRVFRLDNSDESHRGRLRVEMGRLRVALNALADIRATREGFALVAHHCRECAVLVPPVDEKYAAILALLVDGEAWSSSSLATAMGVSQRTVQRALDALAEDGKALAFGHGRARRWTTPSVPGFATTLLLPAPLPVH